jgi:hypothetical protein
MPGFHILGNWNGRPFCGAIASREQMGWKAPGRVDELRAGSPDVSEVVEDRNHFTLLTKTAVVKAGMVAVPSFALKVD